ncbi:HSD3B [Mytilus edulis]|uniref:HSD3B n=1 Tax=Mytilus edulis TaxID=6550 RepID=A0A8S3UWH9_MYTED|nr:HSD3B [Mytilus edulis]
MSSTVVLVTGGSGFLGQHVIKHLQLHSSNLKEIRVLDLVPFRKKLEYKESFPVRSFIGSITNKNLVREACNGTDAVLHIASLVDSTLFPNEKALQEVNVKGTEVVLEACKVNSVPILIYCSSISIYVGHDEVKKGTETTVPIPHKFMFEKYAKTKLKAQNMVLGANGDILKNGKELKTCAILPLAMYGELDINLVYQYVSHVKGTLIPRIPKLGKMEAEIQVSYVGNVAMMFVKALEVMRKGVDIGGEYFYAADDTPLQTLPSLLQPYLDGTGHSFSSWYIPLWLVLILVIIVQIVMGIIRPWKKVNTYFNIEGIRFLNKTFHVTYEKANRILGYKPIYNLESSINNSNVYYNSVLNK